VDTQPPYVTAVIRLRLRHVSREVCRPEVFEWIDRDAGRARFALTHCRGKSRPRWMATGCDSSSFRFSGFAEYPYRLTVSDLSKISRYPMGKFFLICLPPVRASTPGTGRRNFSVSRWIVSRSSPVFSLGAWRILVITRVPR